MTDSTQPARHISVLPRESMHWLNPQPGQTIVDATLGLGGHAQLVGRELGPTGRLVLVEQDEEMIAAARSGALSSLSCPYSLVQSNFDNLPEVLNSLKIRKVDGLIADLGFASTQMEDPNRGLSFQKDGPLDMRLNPAAGEPASALLVRLGEKELADLFWKFGEERLSRRIARRIVEIRRREPIETTTHLADIVRRCYPRRGRIDPATRVFQALRIAVNDELGCLERLLAILPESLRPGGRAVIISFHSLEDRQVKHAFRQKEVWKALTKKPVQPTLEEKRNNPRARSAKLRAGQVVDSG